MAAYTYTGYTYQLYKPHANVVVALKIDPEAPEMFTVLDEATAASGTGEFTLTWNGWGGRVLILALDEEETSALDCRALDWETGTIIPAAYFSAVMANSPAAYYEFDSGNYTVDSSGNNNTLTFTRNNVSDGVSLIGAEGNSLQFDGTPSNYVIETPVLTGIRSFEIWSEGLASNDNVFVSRYVSNSDRFALFYFGTSSFRIEVSINGITTALESDTTVDPTAKMYLVLQYEADNRLYLYVNGVKQSTSITTNVFTASSVFSIGAQKISGAYNSTTASNFGRFDEIAFHTTPLSEATIANRYALGAA